MSAERLFEHFAPDGEVRTAMEEPMAIFIPCGSGRINRPATDALGAAFRSLL